MWQVSWAHPKFGNILASCSYDGRVFIWKEQNNVWTKIKEHTIHTASGNLDTTGSNGCLIFLYAQWTLSPGHLMNLGPCWPVLLQTARCLYWNTEVKHMHKTLTLFIFYSCMLLLMIRWRFLGDLCYWRSWYWMQRCHLGTCRHPWQSDSFERWELECHEKARVCWLWQSH